MPIWWFDLRFFLIFLYPILQKVVSFQQLPKRSFRHRQSLTNVGFQNQEVLED